MTKYVRHPWPALVLVTLAILSTEMLVMMALERWVPDEARNSVPANVWGLVDAVLVALTGIPVMYAVFIRPMLAQRDELLRNQRLLNNMNAVLEQKVLVRARDLLSTQIELERDIDERKRIEADLRRHEEMLNEAQRLVHMGSWDLDLVSNSLFWSSETFRIFEVEPVCRDVYYDTFMSRVHPDDRELVDHAYADSVREKTDYDIIHRLLCSDGRVKWVHERGRSFYDSIGNPVRSVGTVQDITEYKQEKDARLRLATILEETPDVVGIVDGAGRTLFLNKAGRRLMELGETEDIGKLKIADYHPEWETMIVLEEAVPTAISKGTWSGETALRSRSGKVIPVLQVVMAHKNQAGDVEFFASVMRDISERKTMEAALRKYNSELEVINRQLHNARVQIEQSDKLSSIGLLAAGVAHEINNPIGFIYSNLGSLDQYLKDIFEMFEIYERAEEGMKESSRTEVRKAKEQKELDFLRKDVPVLMKESRDGLERVKKIIHDLKEFSHVDTSDEWRWADLHKGLESTLGIVWNEIKYRAEITKEYGDVPEVECLPSQLNQVFMNLLINAAHAIENKGVITIRTGMRGEEIFVQIADTGKGISPEYLNRIFDPFFTTKPIGKGTGLGLSLSFGIMQKHNGRIEVQSDPGKGAAFTVWLPVKQPVRER